MKEDFVTGSLIVLIVMYLWTTSIAKFGRIEFVLIVIGLTLLVFSASLFIEGIKRL